MISTDTQLIWELYKDHHVDFITAERNISSDGKTWADF